jgi:hypothetical protein
MVSKEQCVEVFKVISESCPSKSYFHYHHEETTGGSWVVKNDKKAQFVDYHGWPLK